MPTAELLIEVNDVKAKAELGQLGNTLSGDLTGQVEKFGEKMDGAFERAHGGARHLGQGLNALTGAFGDVAGEAGKAVGEIGHIAGLASVGGPVAASIGLIAFAYSEVMESSKKAKEADDLFEKGIVTMSDAIEHRALGNLDAMQKKLEALGLTANEVARDQIEHATQTDTLDFFGGQKAILLLQEQKAQIDANVEGLKKAQEASGSWDSGSEALIGKQLAIAKSLEQQIGYEKALVKSSGDALDTDNRALAIANARVNADDRHKKLLADIKGLSEDIAASDTASAAAHQHEADAEAAVRAEMAMRDKFDAIDEAADKKEAKKKLENEQDLITASIGIYEQSVIEKKRRDEQAADETAEYRIKKDREVSDRQQEEGRQIAGSLRADAEGAATAGAGAIGTFIDASIKGHKYAAQEATAAFSEQIGQQLVGMGLRDSFTGAGFLIAGDIPQGAAMLALGAAELGAGIGLGAVGSSITASIPSAAASDPGVNRGGASSSRDSSSSSSSKNTGETVINYWGPGSGGNADDYAKTVTDHIVRAKKRGML